ncbi:MAG: hypothetical protein JWR67_936 [Mucilaginibacter sp.]|nr:hypothetical protein [Mucilaginibacter sp.]
MNYALSICILYIILIFIEKRQYNFDFLCYILIIYVINKNMAEK